MFLEDQIKLKKDWINPPLSLIFLISSFIILFLIGQIDAEALKNPLRFYPLILIYSKHFFNVLLFFNIALFPLLIGAAFFLWFGLGTQKCNLGTFGFGFGVPASGVILACSTVNYFLFSHNSSSYIIIFSIICLCVGFLHFLFRHNVDRMIIYQIIPLNDKITEINLKKLNCPYGLLRLQRAISRGIRAQYLNPFFYLDKEKLIKSNVKIIDKKYLYKNVHASHWFGIIGYGLCLLSVPFLILYFYDGFILLIIFFIIFSSGIICVDYYYIRRLNLRKTILILDHWLKRTGQVDLTKIDKDFGFLPIKYSVRELKNISKRYETFLKAKLNNDKLIKKEFN
ncbi:MAG: hypothetical protein ACTSR3_20085 [Candidatus Helarchaeota archaeon]